MQAKHANLFSLRNATGPWPACLELCGLVPANFEVPGFTRVQVAVLVQSYLLDVVRRSWEIGWPDGADRAAEIPDNVVQPVQPVVLQLPDVPPKLSATTSPWPETFCADLLTILKTLTWPKEPTKTGVSWAELAAK